MLSLKQGKELNMFLSDYVIIDIETTGLNSNNNEVLEISALKVKSEEIIKEFDLLVKPMVPITPQITEITGITNSMVEQSPSIKDAFSDFITFIEDDVIVCFNASFDFGFLNHIAQELFRKVIGNDYIDTYHIAREHLPKMRLTVPSLSKYYGINFSCNSRTLTDCYLVKGIYECLFKG